MAKDDHAAPKKDEPVAVSNHTAKITSQVLEKVGKPPRASCGGVSAPRRQLPGQHLGEVGADGGLHFFNGCPSSVVLLFEGLGYR